MSLLSNLYQLRRDMKSLENYLRQTEAKLNTSIESMKNSLQIDAVSYKEAELIKVRDNIKEMIRKINNSIIPNIDSEIEDLEEDDDD